MAAPKTGEMYIAQPIGCNSSDVNCQDVQNIVAYVGWSDSLNENREYKA